MVLVKTREVRSYPVAPTHTFDLDGDGVLVGDLRLAKTVIDLSTRNPKEHSPLGVVP